MESIRLEGTRSATWNDNQDRDNRRECRRVLVKNNFNKTPMKTKYQRNNKSLYIWQYPVSGRHVKASSGKYSSVTHNLTRTSSLGLGPTPKGSYAYRYGSYICLWILHKQPMQGAAGSTLCRKARLELCIAVPPHPAISKPTTHFKWHRHLFAKTFNFGTDNYKICINNKTTKGFSLYFGPKKGMLHDSDIVKIISTRWIVLWKAEARPCIRHELLKADIFSRIVFIYLC